MAPANKRDDEDVVEMLFGKTNGLAKGGRDPTAGSSTSIGGRPNTKGPSGEKESAFSSSLSQTDVSVPPLLLVVAMEVAFVGAFASRPGDEDKDGDAVATCTN